MDPPAGTSRRTVPLAAGFQAVTMPFVASSAAMLLRFTPPRILNCPPTYTAPASADSVVTRLSAAGFHEVGDPVAAASASRRLRARPATRAKVPAADTVRTVVVWASTLAR